MLSNGRVISNSTNKQKDKEKQDDTPLQPRQLLPFLQTEEDRKMRIQYKSILFVVNFYNSTIYYNKSRQFKEEKLLMSMLMAKCLTVNQ